MSMFLQPFSFASTPEIIFGAGSFKKLPALCKRFGSNILLVTGGNSFVQTDAYKALAHSLPILGEVRIPREPNPEMIDETVSFYHDKKIDLVIGIGGGSVLDAAKAISAMLPLNEPIQNFLEGVGNKNHPGVKVPMIAIPTTAGTGSEATKNAVISKIGLDGYKKSLRHLNFVPNIALVDPELMMGCPAAITAYSGMDAFTQLLESYTSTNANTFSDALAERGLFSIHIGLKHAVLHDSLAARSHMAHAALISGITLANAGLGTVHGFASSVGGYFDIPHGIICSRMMLGCNEKNISHLKKSKTPAYQKYVYVGKLFSQKENASDKYYLDFLLNQIAAYTDEFEIPKFASFGVTQNDVERIVQATENKNNPVELKRNELEELVMQAI